MAAQKLDIFKVLAAMDNKQYDFYDTLTDEEKKAFTAFITMKWGASVNGAQELQHYYLAAVNHYVNKGLFDINRHPKLQWLTLAAASPGVGKQRHEWLKIKAKQKDKKAEIKKELAALYPTMKQGDIDVMAEFNTKRELNDYKKRSGDD